MIKEKRSRELKFAKEKLCESVLRLFKGLALCFVEDLDLNKNNKSESKSESHSESESTSDEDSSFKSSEVCSTINVVVINDSSSKSCALESSKSKKTNKRSLAEIKRK